MNDADLPWLRQLFAQMTRPSKFHSEVTLCSRQRSKSSQPPLAIQATRGVISRRKTSLELFQIFRTLAERGRERKGSWTHQLLPLVVLHAPNSGLRLEREKRLNYFYLPQKSSSFEKLRLQSLLNCKRDHLLHKISLSKSEDQPFSCCIIWRSDSFSALFLSSLFFIFSSRSKALQSATCTLLQHQPKGDGGPPDFHLNSLSICSRLSPLQTSTS